MRVLGCWYSNNHIHAKIMASSLCSLASAANSSKVARPTVRTCTWLEISNNPFCGHLTHFRLGVHFGIVIQILRILYEEERKSRGYDAICFLEHDVIYPHDYFDRVATMLSNDTGALGVSHKDYIGMNQTGWLEVNERHEPMHQLSLRYDFGRCHLEQVLRNCITDGAELLEPHDKSEFAVFEYVGERPSCHINHSRHFTSHYNIYATDSGGLTDHPYWGDYAIYYPVGEELATNTEERA